MTQRETGPAASPAESPVAGRAPRQLSRLRRALVAATAIGITLLAAFVVLEFGLARFYYTNATVLREDEFDPELGWRLKAGVYTVKPPQTLLTHTMTINRLGLREVPKARESGSKGVRRVIVLGDSFTYGQAVDDETLFTTQLERRLNQHQTGVTYEVINAGVPGYGTAQELLLARRLIDVGIIGDVYVLNLFTNDLLDNLRLDYASRLPNPVQPGFDLDEAGNLVFTHRPEKELRAGTNLVRGQEAPASMLLSVLEVRLRSLAQTTPSVVRLARGLGVDVTVPRLPGVVSAWYDDEVLQQGLPLMKALIREIDATVRRQNAVLLVSLIPSPTQVYLDAYGEILRSSFPDDPLTERFLEDPNRAQRLIRTLCEDLRVPFLDVYDVFSASDRSLYIPADGHFNAAGHSAFAESLERFVAANPAPAMQIAPPEVER